MTEQNISLILNSLKALHGEITPCLRSVSVELREKKIVWQCLFDSDATEDDFELLSSASAELIADYDSTYGLEEVIEYVPFPKKMDLLENLIYLRHEKSTINKVLAPLLMVSGFSMVTARSFSIKNTAKQ